MQQNLTRPEVITLRNYDRVAKVWAEDHASRRFWGDDFETFNDLLPSGRLLELGCGSGRDAKELIELGYDYTGVDISTGMLAEASKSNPGAKFVHGSLYDLNFEEPFDGMWCAAVLIHTPRHRMDEALQSIRKNLVTGAIGYIAMKEGSGERIEARPENDNANLFFSYWQRDEFREKLATNGYKSVHETYKPMSQRTKWLSYIVKTT